MKDTKVQKANLQLKKTAWLPIGLTAMFLICTAFLPAKAQTTKTDTAVKEEPIFIVVEEQPEFIGGEEARLKFLMDNLKYPREAKEANLYGKVIVSFVVEVDGSLSNIKILRSVHPLLDAEAIRVVKLMPNWKAGKQRGKAVRVQYHLPITFILNGKPKEDKRKK